MKSLCIFLIIFVFIQLRFCQVYISPTGIDTNNGSVTSPIFTFPRALQIVNLHGGFIEFAAGAYPNVKIELINMGNISLIIRSEGGTFLEKHDIMSLNVLSGEHNTMLISNTSGVTLIGLSFIVNERKTLVGVGSHLYLSNCQNIYVQDCLFQGNMGLVGAGAYLHLAHNVSFVRVQFQDNVAIRRDLVLETLFSDDTDSFFNFSKVSMIGNSPYINTDTPIAQSAVGGGIYLEDASATITQCLFKNNSAQNGGAIFLNTNITFKSEFSIFDRNVASVQGSVLYSNDVQQEKTVIMTSSHFLNNICRVWNCKLIFSEIWKNQYNTKLADVSPNFVLIVDCIVLSLVVLILISGVFQFLCIFVCRKRSKKINSPVSPGDSDSKSVDLVLDDKKVDPDGQPIVESSNKVEDGDSPKVDGNIPHIIQVAEEEPDVPPVEESKSAGAAGLVEKTVGLFIKTVTDEEGEEEEIEGNARIINNLNNAFDKVTTLTTTYLTPVTDSGIFSVILQWLFSLVGLTYPYQIPKIWRVAHSFAFAVIMFLTASKSFAVSFGIPRFFYDVFDWVNIGFGSLEYLLVFAMPCVAWGSMLIGSNVLKSVIFRERQSNKFAGIVVLTIGALLIGFSIAVVASVVSLELFDPKSSGYVVISKVVYIVYWVVTAGIITFLLVITVILAAFMNTRIREFFERVESQVKKGRFNYEETVVNYARMKEYLEGISSKTWWYLTPILAELGTCIILMIIMELWGIKGFFTGQYQNTRYAVIVVFSALALFLFLTFGYVTQVSAMSRKIVISMIVKVGNDAGMKKFIHTDSTYKKARGLQRNKTMLGSAKGMIRELHEFSEFLATNTFEYVLIGIIPLYITTIVQYATLFISLFAAARTLQSTLSSTLYSF